MIALIKGELIYRSPQYVIVDVHGVGYRLLIPLSTFYKLPEEGSQVRIHTYTCVREDSMNLYGFLTTAEKELFEKLISVSKIGPRLGLNILSGLPADELKTAIYNSDVVKLSSIPGVGIKTAQRLVLELKDKITPESVSVVGTKALSLSDEESRMMEDVLIALINLGYKKKDADKALKAAWDDGERNVEILIRKSLSRLAV